MISEINRQHLPSRLPLAPFDFRPLHLGWVHTAPIHSVTVVTTLSIRPCGGFVDIETVNLGLLVPSPPGLYMEQLIIWNLSFYELYRGLVYSEKSRSYVLSVLK